MRDPSLSRPSRRGPRRLGRASFAAIALAAIVMLIAACSSATGEAAPRASSSTSSTLAFSQCMRSHGVPQFPNPSSNGQLSITPQEGNINSPQFKSALNACRSYEKGATLNPDMGNQQTLLKYAQCMRSHGISDFPDPSPGGGTMINPSKSGDMNPSNPLFQKAQKACYSYLRAAIAQERGGQPTSTP